jgi:hypothetical protein
MKKFTIVAAAALALLLAAPPPAEATISFSVEILNVQAGAGATRGYRFRMAEITFDSSYPAGGWAITAANFQLNTIKKVYPFPIATAGTSNTGILIQWDKTNSKLKCYKSNTAATFQECAAGDANAMVGQVLVIGY